MDPENGYDQPTPGPDDADERPGTEQPDGATEREDMAGPSAEGTPGSSSALVMPQAIGPPPRRTGVFVDADSLRAHVGDLLRTYLGGYQVDAYGNYTFTFDEARIFVNVPMSPIGPQVGVFSITNVEVGLTPELATFLLTTNHSLGFGSFSYDRDNQAVWLKHTLLGATLDAPELQAAVAAVASTAAHFDDRIRDQYGGRAFHDAPEDVQQQARPPEPSGPGPAPAPNASGYL